MVIYTLQQNTSAQYQDTKTGLHRKKEIICDQQTKSMVFDLSGRPMDVPNRCIWRSRSLKNF